jgi:hypothetical protein
LRNFNGYYFFVDNPIEDTYRLPLDSDARSLSLELIYDWSTFRISVAVVVPLPLSLAVGIWYMKRYDDVVAA